MLYVSLKYDKFGAKKLAPVCLQRKKTMYIITGLGNPGDKYARTRHNAGFITVNVLAKRHDIKFKKSKFKALIGEGTIHSKKILLVKPETYMNLSGESVQAIMNFYKAKSQDLSVIYDDVDLPVGHIRIRKQGSAGTHNGMRNIIYMYGKDDFARFRIGIKSDHPVGNLADFVISDFSKAEIPIVAEAMEKCADAVEEMILNGIDSAMNKYNG